ncbi:glycosyltransferase family 1 protein [Ceratobasidium sp. AG-Ba]|nr:glycosyltransferase family 1 protein [Ceratobasidium sp. AG-Ba]
MDPAPPEPTSSRSSSEYEHPTRDPSRHSSTWSASVDPNAEATSAGQPSLFRMLNAAAQYSQILSEDPSESDSDGVQTPASEAAADLPQVQVSLTEDDPLQHHAFPSPETALANLALHPNVRSRAGSTLSLQRYKHYAASIASEIDLADPAMSKPEASRPVLTCDQAKMGDHAVALRVLQYEFGTLTLPGETEEMILEADGALFRDVTIIGVIHLTTHRLTFHASLLPNADSTPAADGNSPQATHVNPDTQIIKAGSAVVEEPRTGILHPQRRRRVWIELSHDMLTTYPDASDEGRVRPIRSILLLSIKDVEPYDPIHPKRLTLRFSGPTGDILRNVDFDTEESCNEWRRETKGEPLSRVYVPTLTFEKDTASKPEDAQTESRGVRICIPLARIREHQSEWWAAFASILSGLKEAVDELIGRITPGPEKPLEPTKKERKRLSFTNSFCSPSPQGSTLSPVTSRSTDETSLDTPLSSQHVPPLPAAPLLLPTAGSADTVSLAQVLHLSVLQRDPNWDRFDKLVQARRESGAPAHAQVVMDWGELVFDEHAGSEEHTEGTSEVKVEPEVDTEMSSAERKIRKLFALDDQQTYGSQNAESAKPFRPRPISSSLIDLCATGRSPSILRILAIDSRIFYSRRRSRLRLPPSRLWSSTSSSRLNAIAEANRANESTTTSELQTPRLERSVSSPKVIIPSTSSPEECVANAPALFSPISRTLERAQTVQLPPMLLSRLPKPINLPASTLIHIPPKHFVCLTIGSRGDVQPYIALALGLMQQGHKVTIVTHEEYKSWCEGWGVAHRSAGGDPGALMKLSVENRMFSPQFFKEGLTNFRQWLDDLLVESWKQCQDADVLIQSPSAMAGAHIAEALKIPIFHAFTMPWTRTNEYPHAFMTPPVEISGSFNYSTYVLFDNVFWQATSGQINRWRRKHLGLRSTDMSHLAQNKIPFIYNFSPAVVPKPLDWKDPIVISGYWFLDDADLDWKPSQELNDFINKARADNKPLVYIAVLKSDVRAILSKGWSARMSKDTGPEVELPPEVFSVDKIPHDWLFPKIDAALHHGGAGTTGASLRAGIPTLIKPWFGDQFFWATRVTKLGAGLRVSGLSSSELADALKRAVSDRVMKEKAAAVGEKIRSENGVYNAIRAIYTYLPRAGQDRTTL